MSKFGFMLQIILETWWCWDPHNESIPARQRAECEGHLCQDLTELLNGFAGQLGGTKLRRGESGGDGE